MAEWGRDTFGGEHLFLLFPIMYYLGKRVLLDWITGHQGLKKR